MNTYLTVSYNDKDAAKALGARWDSDQRQWYVPDGRELAPFAQWLPNGVTVGPLVDLTPKKGISLSTLLAGVSQAVKHAYKAGVWTLVEVVELRVNGGHVYLGLTERDAMGSMLARTSAVIWKTTADSILPEFQRATGAQLSPGIKLLVRARPAFEPRYGFSIEIDAIDPEYILGDLEARKREIRKRLQADGVFTANKQIPAPWDFNTALVVAPAGGAGLGDFQVEADRLVKFGVCSFTYVYSRFQGEGAAKEICDALQSAVFSWQHSKPELPDAVVIIRGGGAVNDIAWLNDYDLARFVCDLPIPVLTGIGHERDSTVLDEVANIRFDTPSKVASGIEQVIAKRAAEAKAHNELIHKHAKHIIHTVVASAAALDAAVRHNVFRHLSYGRLASSELLNGLQLDAAQVIRNTSDVSRDALQAVNNGAAMQLSNGRLASSKLINGLQLDAAHVIRTASYISLDTLQAVKDGAAIQLSEAKLEAPAVWGQITQGIRQATQANQAHALAGVDGILVQAGHVTAQARASTSSARVTIDTAAYQNLREAANISDALFREIAGQGPDKTLRRGFALVRSREGKPVTRASQTKTDAELEIEFSDGKVAVVTTKHL